MIHDKPIKLVSILKSKMSKQHFLMSKALF